MVVKKWSMLVAVTLFILSGCGTAKSVSTAASNASTGTPPSSQIPLAGQKQDTTKQVASSSGSSTAPSNSATGTTQEKPLAPEKNPVGDIPDSQAFVKYHSKAGGYSLEVPEGWARTEQGLNVSFVDKLGGVKVDVTQASAAPTADSVRKEQGAVLEKSGHAVKIDSVKEVKLPSGNAIMLTYSSNSEPDSVTGKQVRQENQSYIYYSGGKLATLTVWAPLGADNADQWNKMSQSFGWN
ncbi:hypothetical protein M5X11_21550 [Paenibacillus alginolyticus]|uniref:Lipoprotein n=1 Tax=Paenibacillus alginolyticus TaxID=59839 RepID=A0ABT4GN32_9BACL|nr:hypothetical protein [Paenibacillus alginolyticus]MCY9667474.1 hypothetical protein [Paenibacillus alginolyticus]MCY9697620.1 hypothetical protein [Paenibacillus alginolyticus]MEC0144887.1 hypothetical protein [Paenibacillus alginolyticus]